MRALALTMAGVVVGSGIFGLPGLAAESLGAAALLGYLVCLVIVGLVGLCLAETASRVDASGGMIGYAAAAFGPTAASVVGILLVVSDGVVANAGVGALLMGTLGLAFPVLAQPLPRAIFLICFYAIIVRINVRGVKQGAVLSQLLTAIKLLPLIALVVFGLPHVKMANLAWPAFPPIRTLGQTSVLLFFAFMGFEATLPASIEARDPARTVPRALLLALSLIAMVYIGLQVVSQGVLGPALATSGASPLGATAFAIFGPVGKQAIVWATVLSTGGLIASDALGSPRAVQSLGQRGILPTAIGAVDPVRGTPANAIYLYHAIACALALFLPFKVLALFGASGTLMMYLICSGGVLRLRRRGVRLDSPPLVVPGGPVIPVLACLIIVLALGTLGRNDLLTMSGLLCLGLLLRLGQWRRSLSLHGSNT